jgi:nucleoside-diphosphate-sugar epimerase
MSRYLVVGAGTVGATLTEQLVARDDDVTLASRTGTGRPGARAISLDASEPASFAAAARGIDTIFLVTSPRQYHRWPQLWPPVYEAAISAARTTSAKLVIMGNLYAYGEGAAMPMIEQNPLTPTEKKGLVREAGWELARAAHERGEIQAVEVRASDYFGPGAGKLAQLGPGFFRPAIAGRRVSVFGSATTEHSWAYLPDIARTLAAAANYTGSWGRAWHVPTDLPLTRMEIIERVNAITGLNASASPYAAWLLRILGVVSPSIRSANDSAYQFTRPFVSDATETERLLGVRATRWDDALPATIDWYRADH